MYYTYNTKNIPANIFNILLRDEAIKVLTTDRGYPGSAFNA